MGCSLEALLRLEFSHTPTSSINNRNNQSPVVDLYSSMTNYDVLCNTHVSSINN